MNRKFISWRRVSTFRQSKSGLGLEAQKEIIRYFIERDKGEWVADYEECYTGTELSGCIELKKAMNHAKSIGATLVIAKTDRFRNTAEALKIYEEMGDGNIMFCDLPSSDKFSLTLFFALAEREALIVSIRTKQALAVRKAQGYALGGANETYRKNYDMKSKEEKLKIGMRRGYTRNKRYLASREVVTFMKVLRSTFPEACPSEDTSEWRWKDINTKGGDKYRALQLMRDYHELDDTLFRGWDFSNLKDVKLQVKLASRINQLRTSLKLAADFESKCHYLAHDDVCESA